MTALTRRSLTTALAMVVTCAAAGPAAAHEEGVLNLASPTVAAGTSVSVDGEDFAAGTYSLLLKGALREYPVGSVDVGDAGTFSLQLAVPRAVEPGAYRLAVVASDGDEAAAVDIEVLAAPAEPTTQMKEGAAPAQPTPSAAELDIQRDWSAAEWFVIGVLFGGALAGGMALLRRREE